MPIDLQEKITLVHDNFIELCLEQIRKYLLKNAGLNFPSSPSNFQKGIEIAYNIPLLGNFIRLFNTCDQICQLKKEFEFSNLINQVLSPIGENELINHLSNIALKAISFYRNYISKSQDKQATINLAVNLYNKFFETLITHKNLQNTINYLINNLNIVMPEAIEEYEESSNSFAKRAKFNHFNFNLERKDLKSKFFIENSLNTAIDTKEENYFLNLPQKRKYFVGRTRELSLIAEFFQENSNKLLIITGQGGIGKDAIAHEFAHSKLKTYNHRVRIILASNQAELELSYRNFAEDLNLDIAKLNNVQIIKLVKKTLATKVLTSLIIFENAEDFDSIKEYIPESNGKFTHHVIITTQNDKSFRDFSILYDSQLLKLKPLSNDEAIEFITIFLENSQENFESMIKLANIFMNIPLCIAHSLAYIKINRINIETYLSIYQEFREKEPLSLPHNLQISNYDIHKDNFFNTISMCISQLKTRKSLIVDVLAVISLLNPDNIPVEFFNSLFSTEEEKNEIIFTLDGYCFIILSEDKKTIKIHSFIQEIVRICLTKDSEIPAKQALKIAHENSKREYLINAPFNKSKVILNQVLSIIKHFETRYANSQYLKKYAASIYNDCGNLYFLTGNFCEATEKYYSSLSLYKSYEQKYIKTIYSIKVNLASTYFLLRKYEESIFQINQVLEFYKSNYESEESSEKICQLLIKKGHNLMHLNFQLQAIECFEQALNLAQAHKDSQLIADIFFNLGLSHKELNNNEISLEYFRNSFKMNQEYFSAHLEKNSHASIILANILKSMQNYEEALSILQTQVKDSDSSQVDIRNAVSFCYIASILRSLDREDESLQNYLRALEILEQLFDQNYFLVGEIQITIANTYLKLEQYLEAEKFYFQALKIFPENSPQYNQIKENLLIISEISAENKRIKPQIINLSRQESYSHYINQVIRLVETLEYVENSQSQSLNQNSLVFAMNEVKYHNQAVEQLMQNGQFIVIWNLLKSKGKENSIFSLSNEQIEKLITLIDKSEIQDHEVEEILSLKNNIIANNEILNEQVEKFKMIIDPQDLANNPGFHQHIMNAYKGSSTSQEIIEIIIYYYQKLESTLFNYNFLDNDYINSIELQLITLIDFAQSGVSKLIPYHPYFFEPHDEPEGAENGNDENHYKNNTSSEEPILVNLIFYSNDTNHDI